MNENIIENAGEQMYELVRTLFPICRSITGNGVRQTLDHIKQHIPLETKEVPSGTPVFDWEVPKEWNVREAYVTDPAGNKVIDFKKNNLHLLNYSIPINAKMSLGELKKHLFTLPDQPDWIPYRTSYYKENWGFCLAHNELLKLKDGEYEVVIESTLDNGHLTYGEFFLPGKTDEEVLLSCHVCHPSLCNDNLSGIALTTFLAKALMQRQNRYSYRFLFIPGTIGSITWLSFNEEQAKRIKHGLVVTCVGDEGSFTYKRSRQGNAEIDRVVEFILKSNGSPYKIIDFYPYGYDERQYCSPGFNLAVGSLSRSSHGSYPEYHTSADNLDLVQPKYLEESLHEYFNVTDVLEHNKRYLNLNPKCEPRLGKRGLYRNVGAETKGASDEMALLWVLNLSDGQHSLFDIAEKSKLNFGKIKTAAMALEQAKLLKSL